MGVGSRDDWNDVFLPAALEPDRWLDALSQLADRTHSSHGQLLGVGFSRDIPFNIATGFGVSIADDFIAIGGASPAINYRIAACNGAIERGNYDGVLHEAHYDAVTASLESMHYVDWCNQIDIPFGCQTNLVLDRIGLVGLATLRTRSDGRTTADQRRTFARAATAARRAVRLQERLEGDQGRLLARAFEAISVAAFILDSRGRILAVTESAEAIVMKGSITLRQGNIEAEGMPLSLTQAVEALVSGQSGLDHVRLRIHPPRADLAPIYMEGFRLPDTGWSLGRIPYAILLVKQPQRDRAGIAAFLRALYQLTAAEADIAMRLYDGCSRSDIAAVRKVTEETLRGQIKAIYVKTGSSGESGLIRKLASMMS